MGEACVSLKILRNCLFPTARDLWVFTTFAHLPILGGAEIYLFCSQNLKTNSASYVVGSNSVKSVIKNEIHLTRVEKNKHQDDSTYDKAGNTSFATDVIATMLNDHQQSNFNKKPNCSCDPTWPPGSLSFESLGNCCNHL